MYLEGLIVRMAENEFPNRNFVNEIVEKDIVVVGAGLAGISAALSAARRGMKTALITDRPILGGSASSEVRVGPGGADHSPWNRYARETGILEEVFNHIHFKAASTGKWRWFHFDQVYFDLVMQEPDIACYLNTSVFKVERDEDFRITSVKGLQLRSEKVIEFKAGIFIDCSGDGTVGFLAGADYRMGREAGSEYNEKYAPDVRDKGTMGATLLFTSVDTGHPVKYEAPGWAIKITDLPSFQRIARSIGKMPDGTFYGFWWVEYGGQLDSVHDDGKIIMELRRLVPGIWDYIKNSGCFEGVENLEMNWMGYLPGKRESRRLLGPYIATSNDFLKQRDFEDRIGFAGWPIDIHPPEGYLSAEPGCTHDYLPGITDIPFRCIYSRNIDNLFFAGRNVSATHEGLGTLRLIPTTAVMGQAAGLAAAMCVERNITPAGIYEKHMGELQRLLARSDVSLIGYRLEEEMDRSRKSRVTASSVNTAQLTEPAVFRSMAQQYGLIVPVKGESLQKISFYMKANKPAIVTADIYSCGDRPHNYRVTEKLRSVSVKCGGGGWYDFEINAAPAAGQKVIVMLRENPDVSLYFQPELLTGFLGIAAKAGVRLQWDTEFYEVGDGSRVDNVLTPCFKLYPMQELYGPENVINGHIRPWGLPNLWSSARMDGFEPEWVRFDFERNSMVSSVELVFNSELNHTRLKPVIDGINSQMARKYRVVGVTEDEEEINLAEEKDNFKRFRVHEFDPVMLKAVKVLICETWGHKHAEIYDVRIYHEGK